MATSAGSLTRWGRKPRSENMACEGQQAPQGCGLPGRLSRAGRVQRLRRLAPGLYRLELPSSSPSGEGFRRLQAWWVMAALSNHSHFSENWCSDPGNAPSVSWQKGHLQGPEVAEAQRPPTGAENVPVYQP